MQNLELFWDVNYYNHPEVTDEMIIIAENKLKVKLPELLITLLKLQNGGYTKGFAFPMKQHTSWSEDHIPLSELFGIVVDSTLESAQNIMDTAYMTLEWGLPEKQVLLSGDGHYWITLDYRASTNPSVRWIDTECHEDILVATSFDEFIQGLVPEDLLAD